MPIHLRSHVVILCIFKTIFFVVQLFYISFSIVSNYNPKAILEPFYSYLKRYDLTGHPNVYDMADLFIS